MGRGEAAHCGGERRRARPATSAPGFVFYVLAPPTAPCRVHQLLRLLGGCNRNEESGARAALSTTVTPLAPPQLGCHSPPLSWPCAVDTFSVNSMET